MSKIKGSLFHKDDKNIWDALMHQTPSKKAVKTYLKSHGLLISNEDEKEDFAEYIAPWFTSFFDQKFIVEEKGGGNARKRFTNSEILIDYDKEEVKELLLDMKKDSGLGLNISIKSNEDSLVIEETYTKADLTKNVLSQNIPKTAEIEIKRTEDNKLLIRSNNDEQAHKIVSILKDRIKESNKATYDEFVISFVSLADPKARTDFFLKLINDIDGYKTVDMKSVAVSKSDASSFDQDDELDEQTLGYIKRIMLDGGSVHQSKELSNLLKAGFYITKIEWTMESKLTTGDKIDLYSEFKNTNNCSDLIYALQRVYTRNDDGTFKSTGKTASHIENSQILSKIESSAKRSFLAIQEEYTEIIELVEPENEDD